MYHVMKTRLKEQNIYKKAKSNRVLFLRFSLHLVMRLCVWVGGLYVCWCRCPQRPEEEVESPAAGVRDICKQPLDAGHQIGSSVRHQVC